MWLRALLFEVPALSLLAIRARPFARAFRQARGVGPLDRLQAGLAAAGLPRRLAAIVAGEIGVVTLALTGWLRRPPRGFSIHRRSSWFAICGLLVLLIAGETVAQHLLISMWSAVAAWIATALSIYAIVWLVGDAHAIRLYPIRVTRDALHVALGVRWATELPLATIASIEPIASVPDGSFSLAILEPSVLVTLREPVLVRGVFGRTRHATRIALSVDDPAALIATRMP